jgi:hypothetical protein
LNEIANDYHEVVNLCGSAREKDSIRDTLQFLQRILAAQGQHALAKALADLAKALGED